LALMGVEVEREEREKRKKLVSKRNRAREV
jgi:hypothetical protein